MLNLEIKQNKYRILLILLGLLLISGWFYWFELRPARIRHDCSWVQHPDDPTHWDSTLKLFLEDYSIYYDFCIKEKGLVR